MPKGFRKVTIQDIGRVAGVSHTAVSFVLSGSPNAKRISEVTRQRILAAADQLGYVRDSVATALQRGYSDIVVILAVTWDLAEFHGETIMSISKILSENGLYSTLYLAADEKTAESFLRSVTSLNSYGLLLLWDTNHLPGDVLTQLAEQGLPILDLMPNALPGLPYVTQDREKAFFDCTEHLIGLGHRKIGVIVHTRMAGRSSLLKLEGYRRALATVGLSFDEARVEDVHGVGFEDGRDGLKNMLSRRPDTTAVLCINDQIALGAIAGARELGLDVPGDFSVAGHSASREGDYFHPKLTTLSVSHEAIAEQVVGSLMKCRTEAGFRPESLLVPMQLVMRESTGPAK